MRLSVKPVTSPTALTVDVDASGTVADLKTAAAAAGAGAPRDRLRLVFKGHILKDDDALGALGGSRARVEGVGASTGLNGKLADSHPPPFPSSGIADGAVVHMVVSKAVGTSG